MLTPNKRAVSPMESVISTVGAAAVVVVAVVVGGGGVVLVGVGAIVVVAGMLRSADGGEAVVGGREGLSDELRVPRLFFLLLLVLFIFFSSFFSSFLPSFLLPPNAAVGRAVGR